MGPSGRVAIRRCHKTTHYSLDHDSCFDPTGTLSLRLSPSSLMSFKVNLLRKTLSLRKIMRLRLWITCKYAIFSLMMDMFL